MSKRCKQIKRRAQRDAPRVLARASATAAAAEGRDPYLFSQDDFLLSSARTLYLRRGFLFPHQAAAHGAAARMSEQPGEAYDPAGAPEETGGAATAAGELDDDGAAAAALAGFTGDGAVAVPRQPRSAGRGRSVR